MVLLEIMGAVIFLIIMGTGMYQLYKREIRKSQPMPDEECSPPKKPRK